MGLGSSGEESKGKDKKRFIDVSNTLSVFSTLSSLF
jgi:hypothetical protein